MIYTVLHYFIFSSVILIYGIGLNNSIIQYDSFSGLKLYFVKSILTVLSTVSLTWVIIQQFLVPLRITELFPIAAVLIFMAISIFLETMIRITTRSVTSDFCFSFLIVILALNESISILDTIAVSIASLLSFIVLLPVLYTVKCRLDIAETAEHPENVKSLLMITLAVIIMIISAGNISWLTSGAFK